MTEMITAEQLKAALPKEVKAKVTPEMVKTMNSIVDDEFFRETYKENLVSYTSVMKDGKFKLQSYLDAVKYVSYKLSGHTNESAYTRTFPDRYQKMLDKQMEPNHIASIISAYNKGVLVNKIIEQTLVPVHVLNVGIRQEAINVLADMMRNARSEKVRSDSATNLCTILKTPETKKIELDIGLKEDDSISELRQTTLELAKQQRIMLEQGMVSPKQVAHSNIRTIEGDSTVISHDEDD